MLFFFPCSTFKVCLIALEQKRSTKLIFVVVVVFFFSFWSANNTACSDTYQTDKLSLFIFTCIFIFVFIFI